MLYGLTGPSIRYLNPHGLMKGAHKREMTAGSIDADWGSVADIAAMAQKGPLNACERTHLAQAEAWGKAAPLLEADRASAQPVAAKVRVGGRRCARTRPTTSA